MTRADAPSPTPRLLLFDVFGTVVDWRTSVAAEGAALGRRLGIDHVDWLAFADAWRAGYRPSMDRVRTGARPWTRLDDLHRMVLDDLIVQFKLSPLPESDLVWLNEAWHRLTPWSDAVEGLRRLRQRFVIAPLSNGNVSLLTEMARRAGLPWDLILSTELVRRYKPDPETYLFAADLFAVPPSALMMVAAHESDLDAAAALGLRTAYVHRPLEFGPGREPARPAPGRFDYDVDDLLGLATRLGA